jgi:hypothetical protein
LSAPAMSRTAFGRKSVGVVSGAIRSDLASRAVICSLLDVFQRDTEILRGASRNKRPESPLEFLVGEDQLRLTQRVV